MKLSDYIWALYLFIYPFYFMQPGDPQIADIFGASLVALNMKSIILSIKSNKFNRNLFLFVMYAFIINTIWMLIIGDVMVIKNSLYYIYGYFIIMFLYSKIKDLNFLKFTLKVIGISLVIQLLLWPFVSSQGVRSQMFFTNPNQLALWALCMLIISSILATIVKPKYVYVVGLALISTFFIFISASKSALFGGVIFWLFFLVKSRKYVITIIPIALIAVLFLSTKQDINFKNITTINNVIERIQEGKTANNQGVQGRGYDRIFNYPQYLLFGAGEGHTERFNSHIELHSTFFSILFSYGIIGFLLFMFAITQILKHSFRDVIMLLGILVLYTLMHMTLRSPLFWITLLFLNHLREYLTLAINHTVKHEKTHMHSWR